MRSYANSMRDRLAPLLSRFIDIAPSIFDNVQWVVRPGPGQDDIVIVPHRPLKTVFTINVESNPLSNFAKTNQIPLLQANGATVYYDP